MCGWGGDGEERIVERHLSQRLARILVFPVNKEGFEARRGRFQTMAEEAGKGDQLWLRERESGMWSDSDLPRGANRGV